MRKNTLILLFATFGFLILQCSQNNTHSIIENADHSSQTNYLKVDYSNNPDTSLLEIIALSNIRKSGYGLLLNVDYYYSQSELDTLKRKFQKLDINAVHSFNVLNSDSLQTKLKVATEGAQFIWILDDSQDWQHQNLGRLITNLQSSNDNSVLIVINKI